MCYDDPLYPTPEDEEEEELLVFDSGKVCKKCGIHKSLREFFRDKTRPRGVGSRCKSCVQQQHTEYRRRIKDRVNYLSRESYKRNWRTEKNYQLKRDYGVSLDEFQNLYDRCDGKCELCGRDLVFPHFGRKGGPVANVDHDHITKKVRGILCRGCNSAIGVLGDSEEGLEKALAYLRKEAVCV